MIVSFRVLTLPANSVRAVTSISLLLLRSLELVFMRTIQISELNLFVLFKFIQDENDNTARINEATRVGWFQAQLYFESV